MEISLLTISVLIGLIGILWKFITRHHDYFRDLPVASMKPVFLVGNNSAIFFKKISVPDFVGKLYNLFPDSKIFGFFDTMNPMYMIRDPEVIHKITIKDFDHFTDHKVLFDDVHDTLFGKSLVALRGQKWRDMRSTLSPAFTGSKMRQMFGFVSECSQGMAEYFLNEVKTNGKQIHEMKDVFSRFSTDVIATSAFGMKVDSFQERDNSFYRIGKFMLDLGNPFTILKFFGFSISPKLMRKLDIDFMSREQTNFFTSMITDTMETREEKGIIRPDMIQLLIQAKKGNLKHQHEEIEKEESFATVTESNVGRNNHSREWTNSEIVAQAFIFFFAGFDTTSTCLTFLSYEIMANPEVQQNLYEEMVATDKHLSGKSLTYEALQKMKYMDMVVSEGLRKWPPAPINDRVCVKEYNLDTGHGSTLKIEKGISIWIPVFGLHRDPQYYPNPDKFDPERFSDENKSNIKAGTYLPFGSGPRNCIGSRFALMVVKAVIYHLLLKFTFEKTEKTQIPLKLTKSPLGVSGEKGVWIEFKPRQ